jgi:protein EFR3
VFPEALFHQLLLTMIHPDHEACVAAHRIFAIVLVPSSVSSSIQASTSGQAKKHDMQRTLSRAVSVFSSSAAIFDKLKKTNTQTILKEKARKIVCKALMK